MALRFVDGFDHYPVAEILNKWTSQSNGLAFGTGRFGGSSLSTANRSLTKTLSAKGTWVIGFAFQHTGASGDFLRFLNGATNQDTLHIDASTGRLSVRRAGSTVVAQGVKQLNISTWYYVELRLVLSDTVGVAHIKVDGITDINATNVDTVNSGTTADRFQFGDPGVSNISCLIDDLYVLDGDGSSPYNDFLGDCRVETLFPNANGNSSVLVGSDGNSTDNYLLVDETNSDDDTTYVESSTVGDKDTYNYGALATVSGTVYAVQILPWARKTDAGSRSIVTVVRHSGTEEDSAAIGLPTTYTYVAQDIRTTKPGGGSFSISDVNGMEVGVKINA